MLIDFLLDLRFAFVSSSYSIFLFLVYKQIIKCTFMPPLPNLSFSLSISVLFPARRVVHEDQYSILEKTKCESISNKSMLLCSQAFEGGKFVESSEICKDIFND